MTDWYAHSPLIALLRDPPHGAPAFSAADWQRLFREARRCNLLARVAALLAEPAGRQAAPARLQGHLRSAELLGASNRRSVRWEVRQVHRALGAAGIPFALLKGAAYLLAGSDAATGRVFGDVDILVRPENLQAAERALLAAGWFSSKLDAYDQRYYREWMHELPPLRHLRRQTDLDVHHAIIPPTAQLSVDMAAVWDDLQSVEGFDGMFTLSPVDRLIHSATHFFHEGELEQGLRDLVDIDSLCREMAAADDGFWPRLCQRAGDLGLAIPVACVLRLSHRLLRTPLPAGGDMPAPFAALENLTGVDRLFLRALAPDILDQEAVGAGLARTALYVRAHHLRMPLHLLLPHLLRKAFRADAEPDRPRPKVPPP